MTDPVGPLRHAYHMYILWVIVIALLCIGGSTAAYGLIYQHSKNTCQSQGGHLEWVQGGHGGWICAGGSK